MMSKSDCFTRSVTGRVASDSGGRSFRPRNSPAMIRISGQENTHGRAVRGHWSCKSVVRLATPASQSLETVCYVGFGQVIVLPIGAGAGVTRPVENVEVPPSA